MRGKPRSWRSSHTIPAAKPFQSSGKHGSCKRCGDRHSGRCPASGRECRKCHCLGHYAKACWSGGRVNEVCGSNDGGYYYSDNNEQEAFSDPTLAENGILRG